MWVSLSEGSHNVVLVLLLAFSVAMSYLVLRLHSYEETLVKLLNDIHAQGQIIEELKETVLALQSGEGRGRNGLGRDGDYWSDSWGRGDPGGDFYYSPYRDDYRRSRSGYSSLDLYGDRFGRYGGSYGRYDDYSSRRYYSSYSNYYSRRREPTRAERRAMNREFKNRTRAMEKTLTSSSSALGNQGDFKKFPGDKTGEESEEQVLWEVPKILHQTWRNNELPAKFADAMGSWRRIHPHWQFEFWDDRRNRELIAVHFDSYLAEYDRMSGIKRADVARIAFLYIYGGVYADIDVEAVRCLDGLLDAAQRVEAGLILGEENDIHAVLLEQRSSSIVSNAVMAGAKGHPFWLELLKEIFGSKTGYAPWCGDDPVECTGPRLLERMTWRHTTGPYGGIVRLPYVYFSPDIARWNLKNMVKECKSYLISYAREGRKERLGHACGELERVVAYPAALRTSQTYAVHLWQCSWCRDDHEMKKTMHLSEVLWRVGNTTTLPEGGVCGQETPRGPEPRPPFRTTRRRRRTPPPKYKWDLFDDFQNEEITCKSCDGGCIYGGKCNYKQAVFNSPHTQTTCAARGGKWCPITGALSSIYDLGIPGPPGRKEHEQRLGDSYSGLNSWNSGGLTPQCPRGHRLKDANGRQRVDWACCQNCPGGTYMCYNDCECACELDSALGSPPSAPPLPPAPPVDIHSPDQVSSLSDLSFKHALEAYNDEDIEFVGDEEGYREDEDTEVGIPIDEEIDVEEEMYDDDMQGTGREP